MKQLVPLLAGVAVLALLPALAAADPIAACQGQFEAALDRGWTWAYLASFGWGFLTSLTPCVYPMIPIVVGVFGARDQATTRRRAFVLAAAYVLGMGVLFSSLGIGFALLGKESGAGSLLSNPWIVVPMVALYLAMAASMFGAFEINLPTGLMNRLNKVGGTGVAGAFALGMVGGLTAAPCTGPFLAGILGFVAQSGSVAVGGSLLFAYALGMGVLFFAIGVFAVSLPKSGRWMEWVKSIGGIALIGGAIYFLRPIVPALKGIGSPELVWLLGAIGLLVVGIALGAVHLSFHDGWGVRARKGVAVAIAAAGILGIITYGGGAGARHLPWERDEAAAFARAKAEGKGVMIDFAADWCKPCEKLEVTFGSDGVHERLTAGYVPLKFDVSAGSDADDDRQDRYKAANLPAVIFLDADGKELGRVAEYLEAPAFAARLDGIETGAGTQLASRCR
jgi:thiol:disulfide interchange protein DsbD